MLQRGAILVLGSMRDGVATLVPAPSTTDHAVARISPYGPSSSGRVCIGCFRIYSPHSPVRGFAEPGDPGTPGASQVQIAGAAQVGPHLAVCALTEHKEWYPWVKSKTSINCSTVS